MSGLPTSNNAESGTITPFPRRKLAQGSGAGMAREQQRSADLKESLPRGISIGWRADGREKPFFVRYGPDRRTESFVSEAKRNDRAEKLAVAAAQEGASVLDFDPVKWRKLLEFEKRTGVTIEEGTEIVLRVRGNLRLDLSMDEADAKYRAIRPDLGIHPKLHLQRYRDCTTPDTKVRYGALSLITHTPDHVRHWLEELKKQGLGPRTRLHHRKNLNVFFERAILEKWCVENPCAAVPPPKVPSQKTPILTPHEIYRLLKANAFPEKDTPCCREAVGRVVFEVFGGMRCASVQRMAAYDVNVARRGVTMHGSSIDEDTEEWHQGHKSGNRKFRQGHPPVLWSWVEFCWPLPQPQSGPPAFVPLSVRSYQYWKFWAFKAAGFDEIPHNRLRHSFASYLLAVTKNPTLVAYLMQHTSLKMLERYEGVADETDGRMVLSMTPEAVALGWERFQQDWERFYQPIPTHRQ